MARVAVTAASMALGGPRPAAADAPPCPEDTAWDGVACAHPRATCGGWDGASCTPDDSPAAERQAESEFATIERESTAICNDEDETLAFVGTVAEVLGAADRVIGEAAGVEKRLREFGDSRPPRWRVAAADRAGSLYDCIRGRFLGANPPLFDARQFAALLELQAIANRAPPGWARAAEQLKVEDKVKGARDRWQSMRDKYMDVLARKAVRLYVTSALLARRYALDGFDLTQARWRLPSLGHQLGKETMTEILRGVCNPTTAGTGPDCRHVEYVTAVFD
jgi:hypothetical protein